MANTIPQGIAANQRTVSTPANNAAGVPSSRLQDQFSQLLKPQNGNVQHGTKRNDTLQGGKGNDQLYGYAGNDVLNGGDGNDYLDGGVGNDTLRGGRGNDTLQGGAGDDLMVDNSGSNTFRGGEGTDTIRLSGKFSDYTITALGNNGIMPAIYPPRPVETGFQLVDKRTGETQTVYSTENFKFADMSLDAKALGSKIDSPCQDLQANQQKWQQANIDSYSFTLQQGGFRTLDALRPVNIEVSNGKVVSAVYADNGQPLPADMDFNRLTVDDLFKQIDEAISNGAEKVQVEYDPQFGFPTSIYIDRSSMIADEESNIKVSNFQRNLPIDLHPPIDSRPPLEVTTMACGEEGDCFGDWIGGTPRPMPMNFDLNAE